MLIAGNWKMHTDVAAARALAKGVVTLTRGTRGVDVAVCPPFVSLAAVADVLSGSTVALGAQNMHRADRGAYTGEISAPMLRSAGCRYVILGHSERRQHFGETDAGVNGKTRQALSHGLIPIICVGELLEERRAGRETDVVERQLTGALSGLQSLSSGALVVAYEPVWAIGTGETATPDTAQAMHALIRRFLAATFSETLARSIAVLYGGSMKPENARELLGQPDVDGGLVGGASLKADSFAAIVKAAEAA